MLYMPQHSRCPNCSGNMEFNITVGKLLCSSCRTMLSVDEYDEVLNKKGSAAACFVAGASDEALTEDGTLSAVYTCSSCGGQISPGVLNTTDHCPFCCNAIVFVDRYKKQQMPDFILPFRKDRKYFFDTFTKLLSERMFVPDNFREQAVFEKIKAVYVPFWLYNITIDGDVEFQVEDQKYVREKNKKLEIHHTVFSGKREARAVCRYIPQDASTEIDDDISQGLEPYDTADIKPFNFAYLSGLDACIYDINSLTSFNPAKKRAEATFFKYAVEADKYSFYKINGHTLLYTPDYINYALFPLWISKISFKNKTYRYAMNGQTGKGLEEFPVSEFKKNMFLWTSCFFCSQIHAEIMARIFFIIDPDQNKNSVKNLIVVIFIILSPLIYSVFLHSAAVSRLFRTNQSSVICGSFFVLAGLFLMFFCPELNFILNPGIEYSSLYFLFAFIYPPILFLTVGMNFEIKRQNSRRTLHSRHDADEYISPADCSMKTAYFEKQKFRIDSSPKPVLKDGLPGGKKNS